MRPFARQARTRVPAARAAVLVLVAVWAVGCQSAEPEVADASPPAGAPSEASPAGGSTPTEGSNPPEDIPTPDGTETLPASPAPDTSAPDVDPPDVEAPAPGADLEGCAPEEATAIDDVIGNQLSAFAAGDFEAALRWATPGFQRSFPIDDFESMITAGFPVAATATGHEVLECRVLGTAAAAVVLVTGEAGTQTLQYGLVELPEGWRIDGAAPLDGAAPGGPPAEVI